MTEAIQSKARQLLQTGQVQCVIGYEAGPRGYTRPVFVYSPDAAEQLVWNEACTHNLTVYLRRKARPDMREGKRTAIVVKPCDSRALNVLVAEKQIDRGLVHVIGVACDGIVRLDGGSAGERQARCAVCEERIPIVYDSLIEGEPPAAGGPAMSARSAREEMLEGLTSMSPGERAEFWLSQFDRCIRCYACRQVCPMCGCPTCLYERDDSLWVGMGLGIHEKRAFHLGRAYHLAGRCVGCDECERVCPMQIPISLLNSKIAAEVKQAFGYVPGMSLEPPPLTTVLGGQGGAP